MAAFGINAAHPGTTAHQFSHTGTPSTYNFAIYRGTGAGPSNQAFAIHKDGDVILGPASSPALATTATDGFLAIRSGNGAPTGTPSNAETGRVQLYYDYANNALYAYNGGWVSASLT